MQTRIVKLVRTEFRLVTPDKTGDFTASSNSEHAGCITVTNDNVKPGAASPAAFEAALPISHNLAPYGTLNRSAFPDSYVWASGDGDLAVSD